MRSPYEAIAVIRACAAELDPAQLKAVLYARLRGGLPGASMSDGRGASETPMPELDEHDAELVKIRDDFEKGLDQLATDALALRKIQRDVLYRQFRPSPKSKEFVRSELKADADDYDRSHDLEVGTTWAKQQGDHDQNGKVEKIEWCLSCLRITGHLCPVAAAKEGGKNGVLCWWCRRHRDGEKWPPIEHVRAHAEGRRVQLKAKP